MYVHSMYVFYTTYTTYSSVKCTKIGLARVTRAKIRKAVVNFAQSNSPSDYISITPGSDPTIVRYKKTTPRVA
jgi:hypothetical protein